jgi:hypothetical protein
MPNTTTLRVLAGVVAAGVIAIGLAAAAGAFSQTSTNPSAGLPAQLPSVATAGAMPSTDLARPNQAQAALQPASATAPMPLAPGNIVSTLPTSAQLAAVGITDPIKIERYHNRIEVEHRDASGRKFETDLDVRTGALIRHELDGYDDHGGRGHDDD